MLAVLVSGESGREFGGTAFRTRLKTRRGTFSQWIVDSFLGGGDAIVVEEVGYFTTCWTRGANLKPRCDLSQSQYDLLEVVQDHRTLNASLVLICIIKTPVSLQEKPTHHPKMPFHLTERLLTLPGLGSITT